MQQPPRFPKLDRDLEVDVCIVGGGITGLSIAYALAKEGVSHCQHYRKLCSLSLQCSTFRLAAQSQSGWYAVPQLQCYV